MTGNRVATFKELDLDLLKHAVFSTLDDIDLRLLTEVLYSDQDIKEVTRLLFDNTMSIII